MVQKQERSPTPASGESIEPSPAIGPDGYPIGPDGWQEAVITWLPPPTAKRRTLKVWLNDILLRAPQGEKESRKAYARRLFDIACSEGLETTADSIETRLTERRAANRNRKTQHL